MPSKINLVLNSILEHNQDTDYGKRYKFDNIKSVDAFQNTVPVSHYDNYAPLIELTTRVGEKDIFTSQPLAGYSLTSGTTGVPRLIPCTQEHIQGYVEQIQSLDVKGSTFALFESMPQNKMLNDGVYVNSISGAVILSYQKKIKGNSHARIFSSGSWTTPEEVLFPKELMETTHLRVLFALIDDNVEQIISPFVWSVLDTFLYIENNWKSLVEDIAEGKISDTVELPKEIREQLGHKLKKNPKRAKHLTEVFQTGFETPVAVKLWPNLKRVVAGGTGSFAIYADNLKRYIGDLPVLNGFYASSEAMFGKAVEYNSDEYVLLTDRVFYEFIPVDNREVTPLTVEELEKGKCYEILVTNNSGFYRYHMGDVIRFEGTKNDQPIITYQYRLSQSHSFGNGTLTEKDVYEAVKALQQRCDFVIGDYCFWADYDRNGYTVFLEPSSYSENTARFYKENLESLEKLLENSLCENCTDYKNQRSNGMLSEIELVWLQPQTQLLYRDIEKYRRKTSSDQLKPVRFIDNPVKEKFFFSMIDSDIHSKEEISYYKY